MSLPVSALSAPALHPFWLVWLDWAGEPVRATTFPGGISFGPGETGDDDLDGHSFGHVPGSIVGVSDVTHQPGGAESVQVAIVGLPAPTPEMLASLARSQWQGRIARLWHGTHDGSGGNIEVAGYYTGYMTQCPRGGDPASGGRVTVEIENYLAVLSQARRRTYQDQSLFDPGDASAARIRASANGVQGAAVGGGGGGNAQPYNPYEQER